MREGLEFSLLGPDLSLSCYSTVALLEWPQASLSNQGQSQDNSAKKTGWIVTVELHSED